MNTFNSNSFTKTLKERYEAIPYLQGDRGAKILVSDSIKSNGFNPEDVLAFIYSTVKASPKLSDAEWKAVLDAAIKSFLRNPYISCERGNRHVSLKAL